MKFSSLILAAGIAAASVARANPLPMGGGAPAHYYEDADEPMEPEMPMVTECDANGGDDQPAIPGVQPRVVSRCKEPGMFALTFDDGVNKYEPEIVEYLDSVDVKATFFLNSNLYVNGSMDPYPSWIKQIYDSGHQVSTHTATHRNLVDLNETEVLWELTEVDKLIEPIIQKRALMMRPPYGSFNNETLRIMEGYGIRDVVTWNAATVDWDHNNATKSMENLKTAVETNCPEKGSAPIIILTHSPLTETLPFVKMAVPYIRERGYRFVTVEECIGAPAYAPARPEFL